MCKHYYDKLEININNNCHDGAWGNSHFSLLLIIIMNVDHFVDIWYHFDNKEYFSVDNIIKK